MLFVRPACTKNTKKAVTIIDNIVIAANSSISVTQESSVKFSFNFFMGSPGTFSSMCTKLIA